MLTAERFRALVKEAKAMGYHPYDDEVRLLEQDAQGRIVKAWEPGDATDIKPGKRLLVSLVPLFWAVTDDDTDIDPIAELAELRKHEKFLAHVPRADGTLGEWVTMTRGEVQETWKRFAL